MGSTLHAFLKRIFFHPSFKTLSVFAGGNLLVAVIGGIGSILQARWIAPETFGEFRKYGILTGYLAIGLVFVHDAFMRQYPYYIGKGEKEEALRYAAAAKWWYVLLIYVFSAVFLVLTAIALLHHNFRAAGGWAVQIVCIWAIIYGAYLGVLYRTTNDFKRLTLNNINGSAGGFVLLALVKIFGYWGLCLRTFLQTAYTIYLNHHYVPVKVPAKLDLKRLVSLAKVSLPLSIPGYINTSLLTASISFFILHYLGERSLGLYGVAITIQGMAMIVTSAIHQMYWPKIGMKYGETHSISCCFRYSLKPMWLSVAGSMAIAVILCIIVIPFFKIIIPKYVEAIATIQILSLNIPLTAAGIPLTIFTISLRYKSIIVLSVIKISVLCASIQLLPKSLEMIALGNAISTLFFLAVGYMLLVRACSFEDKTRKEGNHEFVQG